MRSRVLGAVLCRPRCPGVGFRRRPGVRGGAHSGAAAVRHGTHAVGGRGAQRAVPADHQRRREGQLRHAALDDHRAAGHQGDRRPGGPARRQGGWCGWSARRSCGPTPTSVVSAYSTSLALDRRTAAAQQWDKDSGWTPATTGRASTTRGRSTSSRSAPRRRRTRSSTVTSSLPSRRNFVKTEKIDGLETYQFTQEIRDATAAAARRAARGAAGPAAARRDDRRGRLQQHPVGVGGADHRAVHQGAGAAAQGAGGRRRPVGGRSSTRCSPTPTTPSRGAPRPPGPTGSCSAVTCRARSCSRCSA